MSSANSDHPHPTIPPPHTTDTQNITMPSPQENSASGAQASREAGQGSHSGRSRGARAAGNIYTGIDTRDTQHTTAPPHGSHLPQHTHDRDDSAEPGSAAAGGGEGGDAGSRRGDERGHESEYDDIYDTDTDGDTDEPGPWWLTREATGTRASTTATSPST